MSYANSDSRDHLVSMKLFFLFLAENLYCGYLLEKSFQGTSNEPTIYFFLRKKMRTISILFV